jgi:hypothetical protein
MAKATSVSKQTSLEQGVSESKAAVIMWDYYKENKANLVADIREYRDYILGELMQGKTAAAVFGQFTKAQEMQVSNAATAVAKR